MGIADGVAPLIEAKEPLDPLGFRRDKPAFTLRREVLMEGKRQTIGGGPTFSTTDSRA